MRKILIIDDDPEECNRLETYLREKGFDPVSTLTAKEGLRIAQEDSPEIILLDRMLPDIDGLSVLGRIKRNLADTYVVMITAHQDMQFIIQAMQLGAYEYIPKPICLEELSLVIDKVIENQVLNKKLTHLLTSVAQNYKVNNIVGKSRSMEEIFKTIGIVSNTKANVLIEGESGTGKELIAKAIHYNSPDSDKPFVSVNCSALVETLLESEFFGHEKGSFTGAIHRKEGKFELARDGTIFLDEISEMSSNLQTKLLRVLQEREFERVGGNEKIKTYARVIAATNRNLEDLVKKGEFRNDLYYRLKVVSILVPPLRERPEDISLLANHFVHKYNEQMNKNIKQISPEAMDLLLKYDWPGNVRELENVIERAVIFCKENFISALEFPEELRSNITPVPSHSSLTGKSLEDSLDQYEKEILLRVLRETRGNKSEASKKLMISRSTLMSKLKKYQIDTSDSLDK